jgi:lysophospholipase L1-like esterase
MGNALSLRVRRTLTIVAVALISCTCVGNARAVEPAHTLLVLGDSITWGANYKGYGNVTPKLQALNTFDKVIVDGAFSRNISGPAKTLQNGVKTYAKYLKTKVRPSAVIVALGSNDLQGSIKVRYYEDRIRELLTLIGDIPVVWVNVSRIDSQYYIRASPVFNKVLNRVALDYPNVSVVDWHTMISANPKWFAFDKLHLQPVGYRARATLYVELAQNLWSVVVPITTTTTTTTTIVAATTIPG